MCRSFVPNSQKYQFIFNESKKWYPVKPLECANLTATRRHITWNTTERAEKTKCQYSQWLIYNNDRLGVTVFLLVIINNNVMESNPTVLYTLLAALDLIYWVLQQQKKLTLWCNFFYIMDSDMYCPNIIMTSVTVAFGDIYWNAWYSYPSVLNQYLQVLLV